MVQQNFGGDLPDIGLMREAVDPAVLALHNHSLKYASSDSVSIMILKVLIHLRQQF